MRTQDKPTKKFYGLFQYIFDHYNGPFWFTDKRPYYRDYTKEKRGRLLYTPKVVPYAG